MEAWGQWVLGGGGFAVIVSAVLLFLSSRRRNTDQARRERDQTIGERVDDGILLADRIREEVALQVKPINEKLEKVKNESHEMNNAVRARETQLWMWDQVGRPGALPMLPGPILERLGLGHLITHHDSP